MLDAGRIVYGRHVTDVDPLDRLLGPRPHRRELLRSLSHLFLSSLGRPVGDIKHV